MKNIYISSELNHFRFLAGRLPDLDFFGNVGTFHVSKKMRCHFLKKIAYGHGNNTVFLTLDIIPQTQINKSLTRHIFNLFFGFHTKNTKLISHFESVRDVAGFVQVN
jgi:hypothetical protein